MTYLGEAIKTRRGQRNMSLQDVADKAGIAKNHVWDLEQGKSRNPSVQTLLGLSEALEMDACTLAGLAFADLPGAFEQGGISDRLSNFDDYGNRIRDRS